MTRVDPFCFQRRKFHSRASLVQGRRVSVILFRYVKAAEIFEFRGMWMMRELERREESLILYPSWTPASGLLPLSWSCRWPREAWRWPRSNPGDDRNAHRGSRANAHDGDRDSTRGQCLAHTSWNQKQQEMDRRKTSFNSRSWQVFRVATSVKDLWSIIVGSLRFPPTKITIYHTYQSYPIW